QNDKSRTPARLRDQKLRERDNGEHSESLSHRGNADCGSAAAGEPMRNERVVCHKSQSRLTQRPDDSERDVKMPDRVAESGKGKTKSHQQTSQRDQDTRPKVIKGVTYSRRRQSINERIERDDARPDAVGPVKLFEQGDVKNAERAECAAHDD